MTQPQPALVELPPDTVTRYVEAHQELLHRLGISPGPEFLMSLAIERENPMELIDVFCATIVQSLRESRA
ncbi:MAG TPA: hypothetical protein VIS71_07825 [Terrimicrobium sp.]